LYLRYITQSFTSQSNSGPNSGIALAKTGLGLFEKLQKVKAGGISFTFDDLGMGMGIVVWVPLTTPTIPTWSYYMLKIAQLGLEGNTSHLSPLISPLHLE
jgi:hypothetical protein